VSVVVLQLGVNSFVALFLKSLRQILTSIPEKGIVGKGP
jgi:hypothetical protein